jgi:hypothetical protein
METQDCLSRNRVPGNIGKLTGHMRLLDWVMAMQAFHCASQNRAMEPTGPDITLLLCLSWLSPRLQR